MQTIAPTTTTIPFRNGEDTCIPVVTRMTIIPELQLNHLPMFRDEPPVEEMQVTSHVDSKMIDATGLDDFEVRLKVTQVTEEMKDMKRTNFTTSMKYEKRSNKNVILVSTFSCMCNSAVTIQNCTAASVGKKIICSSD